MCACSLQAQINSVRVYTKPAGAIFYVDEQSYTGEVTLLWPAGSKHFIRTQTSQPGISYKTLYTFSSFNTNLGTPASVWPITNDAGLTFVELDFSLSYAVTLSYYPCPNAPDPLGCTAPGFPLPGQPFPPPPPAPPSPGEVSVNGTVFWADGEIYVAAGSTVQVEAHPSDGCSGADQGCRGGYIFTGWGLMPGVPKGTSFIWSFPLNQPQVVHPLFQQAQPIQINVLTSPPGLQLLIDRTPVVTPVSSSTGGNGYATYYWGWGTDHEVGAIPVQRDLNGHVVIFSSWSDGGPINHVYHMTGTGPSILSLTATFVPGAAVSFLTSPPGLTLSIDGRKNWQSYNFNWAQGTAHTVSAPLTQTDAQGHLYKFVSWSNGGSADQTYTVADAPDDQRITAVYQPVAQFNVSSVPTGITLKVDGGSCTTPCALQRDMGAQLSLAAPAISPVTDGTRLVFLGWGDSSSPTRTVTASTADPVQLNLTYQLQYQLTASASPSDAVLWSISPATNDGYYNAQSVVALDLKESPGYRFMGWNGDAGGVTRPLGVPMNAPKNITVMLDPVPFVDQGGVKNGAGDTPEQIVAPGSVVSVVGINLASDRVTGPASPLKQSLAGVSVRAAGMLMPLFFVSPSQINGQLPFEISEGPQTLTVSVPGKPDISVNFTVSRNAPGLFNTQVGDIAYATATHADGSPVTLDSPAAQGETITLFGTGFGPYLNNAPDGFALPADPNFVLADPVTLVVSDSEVPVTYAGVADQQVGVNAVSFTIDDTMPQGTNVPVKVKINGHVSNTVILPLK